MSASSSFARLLQKLQVQDQEGAAKIVERFAADLIALAARRLGSSLRRKVDPEDAVQSVFLTFFRRLASGEFDGLQDWESLWGLLACITACKCTNLREHFDRQRRNRKLETPIDKEIISPMPRPEDALMLEELIENVTRDVPRGKEVVDLRQLGHSVEDVAQEADCSERTVHRVLALVKKRLQAIWFDEKET